MNENWAKIDQFTPFIKYDYMPAAILDAILNTSRVFEEDIPELLIC